MKTVMLIFTLALALNLGTACADKRLFRFGPFEIETQFEEKLLQTKPADVNRQFVKGVKTVKWFRSRIGAGRSEIVLHLNRSSKHPQRHRLDIFAHHKTSWTRINQIEIVQSDAELALGNPEMIGAYWLDPKTRKVPVIAVWVPDVTFEPTWFVSLQVFSRGLDHPPTIQKFEVYPQSIDDSQSLSIKTLDKRGNLQPQLSHVHWGRPEGGYESTEFYEWNGRAFAKTYTK